MHYISVCLCLNYRNQNSYILRPVARFSCLGVKIIFWGGKFFVFIICLNHIFLDTKKF